MQKDPKNSFPSDIRKNPKDCMAAIYKSKQRDAEKETIYNKCLAKDTKMSSFLGGNPSRNFYFLVV